MRANHFFIVAGSILLLLSAQGAASGPEAPINQGDPYSAQVTVLYTGGGAKFLQECDCEPNIYTNLAARDYRIDITNDVSKHMVLFDLGRNLVSAKESDQERSAKYLELLGQMRYDAVLLGADDLCWGERFLMEQAGKVRLVSANLTSSGGGTMPWLAHVVVNTNGFKVGVFGLTRRPEGLESMGYLRWYNPVQVAQKTVRDLQAKGAQIIVCLSDLSSVDNAEVVRVAPDISVLLTTNAADDFYSYGNSLIASGVEAGEEMGQVQVAYQHNRGQQPVVFVTDKQLHKVPLDKGLSVPFKRIYRKMRNSVASSE